LTTLQKYQKWNNYMSGKANRKPRGTIVRIKSFKTLMAVRTAFRSLQIDFEELALSASWALLHDAAPQ
jgi:hypothetical protein